MRTNSLARKALVSPGMLLLTAVLVAIGTLNYSGSLRAQDDDRVEAEVEDAASGDSDRTRRLPAYYSEVVTEAQKADIYRIQAKYAEQIDALKAQLRQVVTERDGEIGKLLTPEQQAKLKQVATDRRAERKLLEEFRERRAKLRAGDGASK